MAKSPKNKRKKLRKTVLKLPDLEHSKSAMLSSLASASSQRSYDHAIREFIEWYCYLSDLGESLGDHALTEIRRFQMAEKPPSTDNSTPFTKLESSEARNSATVAISSG